MIRSLPISIAASSPGEVDLIAVAAIVRRDGAALVSGLRPGVATLERVSDGLGRSFVSYPGTRREAAGGDDTLQTVEIGNHAIPLHAELSYLPSPPDLCFFACERAPARGGETTLCDGIALARALPAAARRLFEGMLAYEADVPPRVWQRFFRCTTAEELAARVAPHGEAFTLRADGTLHVRHLTPGLPRHRIMGAPMFANNLLHNHGRYDNLTFEDGSLLGDAMYEELAGLADALTCEVAWEAGDVLVVDNTRVMHGRRAITDERRRILARFGSARF